MEVGRCVGGLRHFGRGQKITFLAGYFRGAWSLQKLVSHDSRKYPAKKLFFVPKCLNPLTHLPPYQLPISFITARHWGKQGRERSEEVGVLFTWRHDFSFRCQNGRRTNNRPRNTINRSPYSSFLWNNLCFGSHILNSISIDLINFYFTTMNSMNISTEYAPVLVDDDGHGHPKESMFMLALKGRQYRSLYCIGWTAFCMISAYSLTSMFSLFSINSLFSVASVNSWFSLWSVNRCDFPSHFPFLSLLIYKSFDLTFVFPSFHAVNSPLVA